MTAVDNVVTITSVNHNLQMGDFVVIENALGVTSLNDFIHEVQVITTDTFEVYSAVFSGVYTGKGTIARISQIDILTKQYNFYSKSGRNAYISKVDCLVDVTDNGAVALDTFISSSNQSQSAAGAATGALLGTLELETAPYDLAPLESTQERVWHPVYLQSDGQCVQLRFYFDDVLATDPDAVWADFQLHAMMFYATPTSNRFNS
jgi:hypothetical protein